MAIVKALTPNTLFSDIKKWKKNIDGKGYTKAV